MRPITNLGTGIALILLAVLVGPAKADFGCDKKVQGMSFTGTFCLGAATGGPYVQCVPTCLGGSKDCWTGWRVYAGGATVYISCQSGAPTDCCNGTSLPYDVCTCVCEDCFTPGRRANFCGTGCRLAGTLVMYTAGACQRDAGGNPVGCQ